jgi:colanic acid/amylovoran biosynthesis glycosyltransferase
MTGNPSQAKPKVLIFRNELLPASETFIRAQAAAMKLFEPRFVGVHASINPIELDSSATLVDSSSSLLGKVRRRAYWRSSFAPAFYRKIGDIQPVLLHAHFALDGAAALPIARTLQIPLIVTLHGYDVTSSDTFLRRSVEGKVYIRRRSRLFSEASLFLCISQFIYERAIDRGFPRKRLRVHYTGTDLKMFDDSSLQRDPNLIVFVGRLVEKKGCRYLLDALEVVRRSRPEVRLVMIGGGPLEHELHELSNSLSLPCEFLGSQSPETVKRYLGRARVFCVPSSAAASGDSEGLGMVFAEAQAMGTPVVSFKHGGIPEVVLDGDTGLLGPERDTRTLAENLLMLLNDDEKWRQYSERGKQWVRQSFDIATQTSELENIYWQLLLAS